MTTPTPTPEHLPLSHALAADGARFLFTMKLADLANGTNLEQRLQLTERLQGMLDAYFETGAITSAQYHGVSFELAGFCLRADA
jgi:hypothetical protein